MEIFKSWHWKHFDVCPSCGKKITMALTCYPAKYKCDDCYNNNAEYKTAWDEELPTYLKC